GSGDGTIRLDVLHTANANSSFADPSGNPLPADYAQGQVYTIDKTPPAVLSSTLAGNSLTNAASVAFTVTFSEDVTGVNADDFALTTTGGLSGASIASIVPVSGSVYTVNVNTGSGDGTLRLDVQTSTTIQDLT